MGKAVDCTGRIHRTVAPSLVARLRSSPHVPEDEIVGMDNSPGRMAA